MVVCVCSSVDMSNIFILFPGVVLFCFFYCVCCRYGPIALNSSPASDCFVRIPVFIENGVPLLVVPHVARVFTAQMMLRLA